MGAVAFLGLTLFYLAYDRDGRILAVAHELDCVVDVDRGLALVERSVENALLVEVPLVRVDGDGERATSGQGVHHGVKVIRRGVSLASGLDDRRSGCVGRTRFV